MARDEEAAIRRFEEGLGGDGPPVRLRFGLHLADVVETCGDLRGDGVTIAARILAELCAASPGVSARLVRLSETYRDAALRQTLIDRLDATGFPETAAGGAAAG